MDPVGSAVVGTGEGGGDCSGPAGRRQPLLGTDWGSTTARVWTRDQESGPGVGTDDGINNGAGLDEGPGVGTDDGPEIAK